MPALKIEIEAGVCAGFGNCELAAPEMFKLDDDTNIAAVLRQPGSDEDGRKALEAVDYCPARAIQAHRT